MARGQAGTVLRHVRQLLSSHPARHVPDVELLRRFAASHEEAAFAELM